jgi:hypothetical protein
MRHLIKPQKDGIIELSDLILQEKEYVQRKGGLIVKIAGIFLAAIVLVASIPGACLAVEVADAVVCQDVQDREPVGAADSFSSDIGKVWCWSKIKDGKGTRIKHVYYYEGAEKAIIELTIGSSSWRTYSSKRILSSWTGQWRVDIVGEDGEVLKSLEFTIVEQN